MKHHSNRSPDITNAISAITIEKPPKYQKVPVMTSVILLDGIIAKERTQYPASLTDDELFEFYCSDNILVNYDLDNAEIEGGRIDGPRDAGIDAAYVFVNTHLLMEDFNLAEVRQPVELELYLIQAKNQASFKEGPVDKLASSLPLLLDHTKKPADLEPLFKKEAVAVCRSFLDALTKLADKFPKVSIRLFYCAKATEPNETIKAKGVGIETVLKGLQFPNVQFSFLGAQQLYDRSAIQKRLVIKLSTTTTPLSGANAFVALCKLQDYVRFITDESGNLITRIFEANVRAYQGEVEVNREIAASLETPTPGIDFWWLNNGVTIVADEASYINNQLVIANPLIVNGLQTSHEIQAQAGNLALQDTRSILIRVVVETDPAKRDKIIRATNRQTSISNSSFRATEPVHREIEDYLLTLGFFYDRRKNAYRERASPHIESSALIALLRVSWPCFCKSRTRREPALQPRSKRSPITSEFSLVIRNSSRLQCTVSSFECSIMSRSIFEACLVW